jgi:hypothetical protein
VALLLGCSVAAADPVAITPDIPARQTVASVPAAVPPPVWDLDGMYLWLGPTGAASRIDGQWDSTFGGTAAVLRVREREPLAAIGGSLGASRWTERGGGRIWLDALAGTELDGHMFGVSAGPIVELSDLAHPRVGGSVGVWGFAGITPFARVGVVDGLGGFAEIGVHLMLPVFRRRP